MMLFASVASTLNQTLTDILQSFEMNMWSWIMGAFMGAMFGGVIMLLFTMVVDLQEQVTALRIQFAAQAELARVQPGLKVPKLVDAVTDGQDKDRAKKEL